MRLCSLLPLLLFAATLLAQSVPPPTSAQAKPGSQTATQGTTVHVPPERASAAAAQAAAAAATQKKQSAPPEDKPVVLDSVVAIINGDVLLQSDVDQERRFEALELLPPGQDTDAHAADRLISRTLILQQMKEEDQAAPKIAQADLDRVIGELKKQLPGCLPNKCESEAGWTAYLAKLGLTPEGVRARWRQRLVILDYLNVRFRIGIRIPTAQQRDYYEKNLVPEFTARHEKPPSFKSLAPRIKEVLLQQQVSKQIDQWETTLRQEGSVQILVPAYGKSNAVAEDDVPGGAL